MRDKVGFALDHEPDLNPPDEDEGVMIDELFFKEISRRFLWAKLSSVDDAKYVAEEIEKILVGLIDD
jgi:hypothetical protein